MNVQKKEVTSIHLTQITQTPYWEKEGIWGVQEMKWPDQRKMDREGHNYASRKWVKTCIAQTQENKKKLY